MKPQKPPSLRTWLHNYDMCHNSIYMLYCITVITCVYLGCGKINALNLEYMNLSCQPSEKHLDLVATLGSKYACLYIVYKYCMHMSLLHCISLKFLIYHIVKTLVVNKLANCNKVSCQYTVPI